MIKLRLELESDLLISLTAMYAKVGQVMVARSLFDQMKITTKCDVVECNDFWLCKEWLC